MEPEIVPYRGLFYRLTLREITGTDSVRNDDGTWRNIEPTMMGLLFYCEVLKYDDSNELTVVDRVPGIAEAKALIDKLVG